MSREALLRTMSAAALTALIAPAAFAATQTVNGGGATSPQGAYAGLAGGKTGAATEFSTFNAAQSGIAFGTYWGSGSTGQTAFLNNDLTCDINKVQGTGGCSNTPGGADTVHYNFSDNTLNSTQIAQWSSSSWGQSVAGNLIQIPTLGTGEAIVVNDTNITKNGQLKLTANDLCEIFSGGYTDFSQITDSNVKPAAGAFQFVYRSDSAGVTFIITEHLSKVCTASNTAAGITFTPTTSFASLFPAGINTAIPNAVGETGNSGIANYLAGLTSSGKIAQAIGYVAPDYTSVPKAPDATLSNGLPSPLLVAALYNGATAYTPTTGAIALGLAHVTATANGITQPPSTAAAGANPANWVPIIQNTSAGYPIVGYGTLDLAQCYHIAAIGNGIRSFLHDHYYLAAYRTIQSNNGLVPVYNNAGSNFLTAINAQILLHGTWHTSVQDPTACKGLAGR